MDKNISVYDAIYWDFRPSRIQIAFTTDQYPPFYPLGFLAYCGDSYAITSDGGLYGRRAPHVK